MDLFDFAENKDNRLAPLAERMRAKTLDDFIGQEHLVGKDCLLRRAIKADRLGSCIFYGPAGTGKTTLANIIANTTNCHFEQLNAVSSGVADAKRIIEEAKQRLNMYGVKTYLLLDECHRWNKAQSDSVLAGIEQGYIVFIGSTTENPYVNMTPAIVSRCRIFEFKKLNKENIKSGLTRAINDKTNGLGGYDVTVTDEAIDHIATVANGDMRTALNALELAFLTTNPDQNGRVNIDIKIAEQSIQKRSLSIDQDDYYDILSAFCKSLRGSDSNAALYWAERLIQAGCDPLIILRRLIVHSSEDVGLANSNALVVATSALTAYEKIGMPEAKIPMFHAIIYVCESPKSNSVVNAKYMVEEAVSKIKSENVPTYLKDANYKVEKISGYKYPHDFGGYVEQQYLPDELKDVKFYNPLPYGDEKKVIERQKELGKIK